MPKLGYKQTQSHKDAMIKIMTGRKLTPEHCANISKGGKGKHGNDRLKYLSNPDTLEKLLYVRTKIYILSDNTGVRYVGKTHRKLSKRLNCHILGSRNPETHCARWIAILIKNNDMPSITQIAEVPGDGAEAEKFYIAWYRMLGADLTNETDGGEGASGYKHTAETKKKIGDKHRGRIHTAKSLKNMSEGHKGYVTSDITKALLSKIGKGRPKSEHAKQALRESWALRKLNKEKKSMEVSI
jgi:hypothetical protein